MGRFSALCFLQDDQRFCEILIGCAIDLIGISQSMKVCGCFFQSQQSQTVFIQHLRGFFQVGQNRNFCIVCQISQNAGGFLFEAQNADIRHFRKIHEISNFLFLDVQQDMQQDSLNFCSGVTLCFDEINDIFYVIAGIDGMQDAIFQTFYHFCNFVDLLCCG